VLGKITCIPGTPKRKLFNASVTGERAPKPASDTTNDNLTASQTEVLKEALMKHQPNATDIEIGKAIRKTRLLSRLSQSDLGAGIGVSFQQVQKYEKGTNRVSASMLTDIARVLHVDVRSFFAGPGPQDGHDLIRCIKPDDPRLAHETILLTEAFLQIGHVRRRRKIIDLVRAIAASNSKVDYEHFPDAAE
jgi:transcriptional regulator with XRE-family HTH domain